MLRPRPLTMGRAGVGMSFKECPESWVLNIPMINKWKNVHTFEALFWDTTSYQLE